ncbi:hypothetical protein [Ekhidna sp. To15]|uniref:hypothetical protein n=1 Tax=Ekhidna sp. To15 TaxID=3395267 RepID=UPI003F52287A
MNEQFQLEEYRRLTSEIENNAKRIFQIISVVLTFSIGIISLAFSKNLHFLLPLSIHLILLSALQLLSTQLHSTFRISTYLSLVYETKANGISWESDMIQYRKIEAKKTRYFISIFLLFLIQAIISHTLSVWIFLQQEHHTTFEIITLSSITIVVAVSYIISNKAIHNATNMQDHIDHWKSLGK